MVGRELWINSAYFSEKAENKRIDGTQTATWRAVLSERVITARLFFALSAIKGTAELHNKRPPHVLHFKKNHEMEDIFMSEWRKIWIQDYYKEAVGEEEYAYVTPEVYEILANTFRKEAHAEQMRDLRNRTAEGFTEGGLTNGITGVIGRYGHPADGNRNLTKSDADTFRNSKRAPASLFF